MKTLTTLLASLMLAALIGLGLYWGGLIQPGHHSAAGVADQLETDMTVPAVLMDSKKSLEAAAEQVAEHFGNAMEMVDEARPARAAVSREESQYMEILNFLASQVKTPGQSAEENLAHYLTSELALEQNQRAWIIRCCFWKNFVTLQQEWQIEDIEKLKQTFMREKKLKKAGFLASGLLLPNRDLEEAEIQMETLVSNLSGKGKIS